jgi:hypothetical protein
VPRGGPAGILAGPAKSERLVRTTRPTVRPDRRGGATTIVFRLARPMLIRFTVVRVYPTCERVGVFRVRARAGVNRVRWRGRLRGRPLDEGTYWLLMRPRGSAQAPAALKLVVVRGRPLSARELHAARNANVCDQTGAAGNAAETVWPSSRPSVSAKDAEPRSATKEAPLAAAAGTIGRGAKALGTRFAKGLEHREAVHPLVWAALALAIMLLALAAVPPAALAGVRADAIAGKRFEIAAAGTCALAVAVLLSLLF